MDDTSSEDEEYKPGFFVYFVQMHLFFFIFEEREEVLLIPALFWTVHSH